MKLNIFNNFRAIYYNTLVNFYLYFNTLVPYYDDVILSLSITSFKNIINNSSISLKTIKQNRMMQLLYSLNDKDKIVVDDDGFVFIKYENKNVNNEIIQDNTTGGVETRETDTEDTTDDHVTDPFVYTQDIVIEDTKDTWNTQDTVDNPNADTQNTIIEDTVNAEDNPVPAPFVYTQDILIDDTNEPVDNPDAIDVANTDETICYNSLDKKNN